MAKAQTVECIIAERAPRAGETLRRADKRVLTEWYSSAVMYNDYTVSVVAPNHRKPRVEIMRK